jgi:thioredoxin reductase
MKEKENIELVLNEEVEEITGDALGMTWVTLKSGKELKADGIFVAVGTTPNVWVVESLNPEKDEEGCLVVDSRQETSVKGLYAAWDVTTNSNKFKQTIMSAAEWCLAANSVHEDNMR